MSEREPGKRLFVGLRISVGTANALAGAAETLARRARDANVDIRWVAPTNYHVTLKFLGWTREAAIGALVDVLDDSAMSSRFTMKCARLGAFPTGEKASVVWAGIEEQSGALALLAKRIEDGAAKLGWKPEARAFHPHVTLGRLRETRAVREVVLPLSEQMFGDTRVDSVILFESETKSSGSVYREVEKIPFKTAETQPETASERQTLPLHVGASPHVAGHAVSSIDHEDLETDDGWPRGFRPD